MEGRRGGFKEGGFPTWTGGRPDFRAFLSLWFAKPMVCMRVAFHENDGNRENDEDNSLRQLQTRSWVLD